MFFLDGDTAVPLLLGSRLFAVWARATTSRSTSWISRFSISGTFETFPIPLCMELVEEAGVRPWLRLAANHSNLAAVASWLERVMCINGMWAAPSQLTDRDPEELAGAWREVDAILLDSIGLPADAADLDVLEQLLVVGGMSPGAEDPVPAR